jgi:hypothetical protein
MTTQPNTQNEVAFDALHVIYNEYMQAKYPGEKPESVAFAFFNAGEDNTISTFFVEMTYSEMLKRRNQHNAISIAGLVRRYKRKPEKPGIYMTLAKQDGAIIWAYLGGSIEQASMLFERLKSELTR